MAPTTPIRPTPRRNAVVALAVGLMLGVGLAFLREYLDDSLMGKEDVERAALGVPVLGLIPEIKGWKDRASTMLVSVEEPQSPAAEASRSLRTSVQLLGLDRSIKIIQVTSPSQAEGKSTTVANLAVGLAKAGRSPSTNLRSYCSPKQSLAGTSNIQATRFQQLVWNGTSAGWISV